MGQKEISGRNRLKSLFNIVNRLNTSIKVSEKEEEMKKLDQELQKEEEMSE
jgi:hypothetical protein